MTRFPGARRFAFAASCALTLGACGIAAIAPAEASPPSPGAAASPAKVPALQSGVPVPSAASLRMAALAGALIEQGDGAYADIYSDVVLDEAHGKVLLYATSTTRAAALVSAAARAHPGIRTGLVRIVRSRYSLRTLEARINQIMPGNAHVSAADLIIYSASAAADGSGIVLSVKPSAVTHMRTGMAAKAVTGAIPVTVTPGAPFRAATTYWRWNDTYPFVSGDALLADGIGAPNGGHNFCTAGLMAQNSAGRDYLITADHCFVTGYQVWGDGGSYGDLNSTSFGNYVGVDIGGYDRFDEALIDTGKYNGAGVVPLEADSPAGTYYDVTSDFNAGVGQGVCQDGAFSYFSGHGVPCSAVVYSAYTTAPVDWPDGTTHIVAGYQSRSTGYVAQQGDSGALVFDVTGSSTRNALGMASGISNYNGYNWLLYTRASDVLGHYNLRLAG